MKVYKIGKITYLLFIKNIQENSFSLQINSNPISKKSLNLTEFFISSKDIIKGNFSTYISINEYEKIMNFLYKNIDYIILLPIISFTSRIIDISKDKITLDNINQYVIDKMKKHYAILFNYLDDDFNIIKVNDNPYNNILKVKKITNIENEETDILTSKFDFICPLIQINISNINIKQYSKDILIININFEEQHKNTVINKDNLSQTNYTTTYNYDNLQINFTGGNNNVLVPVITHTNWNDYTENLKDFIYRYNEWTDYSDGILHIDSTNEQFHQDIFLYQDNIETDSTGNIINYNKIDQNIIDILDINLLQNQEHYEWGEQGIENQYSDWSEIHNNYSDWSEHTYDDYGYYNDYSDGSYLSLLHKTYNYTERIDYIPDASGKLYEWHDEVS